MWRDYLTKARKNLESAIRDFESQAFDPCVSRAYYAAFQSAIAALLALTDFQRRGKYWDHGEIAAAFVRRLVHNRKIFSKNLISILDDLKTRRHQADYDTRQTSQKVAQRSLDKAHDFVVQIEKTLGVSQEV